MCLDGIVLSDNKTPKQNVKYLDIHLPFLGSVNQQSQQAVMMFLQYFYLEGMHFWGHIFQGAVREVRGRALVREWYKESEKSG